MGLPVDVRRLVALAGFKDWRRAVERYLTQLDSRVASITRARIGELVQWSGSTLPAGYVRADGAVYTIEDHQDLYDRIGTAYNTGGEPAGSFRVPNMLARKTLSIGATGWSWGTSQLERDGASGGWWFVGRVSRTGAALTTDAVGNIPDTAMTGAAGLPAGMFSTTAPYQNIPAVVSGVGTWWVRVNPDGALTLTHGPPSSTLGVGTSMDIRVPVPVLANPLDTYWVLRG